MPIGFLEAPFAGVFEQFIHRHEHYARPFHIQSQIEGEFVVKKMDVAVAEHTEERASSLEILGVNDAVPNSEFGVCFMGDAVSASGHDVIQNSGQRPKNRYGEDVPVAYFNFSVTPHRPPIVAQAIELVGAA